MVSFSELSLSHGIEINKAKHFEDRMTFHNGQMTVWISSVFLFVRFIENITLSVIWFSDKKPMTQPQHFK